MRKIFENIATLLTKLSKKSLFVFIAIASLYAILGNYILPLLIPAEEARPLAFFIMMIPAFLCVLKAINKDYFNKSREIKISKRKKK